MHKALSGYISYSKTSLTDHLHRPTTSQRSYYLGSKRSPITIYLFLIPTTSLNGALKVGPMAGFTVYIYIYIYICISQRLSHDFVYIYIYMYRTLPSCIAYIYICIYICIHIYAYICIYICIPQ